MITPEEWGILTETIERRYIFNEVAEEDKKKKLAEIRKIQKQ